MLNKLYSDSEVANTFWLEKIPKYLKSKFRYSIFKTEKGKDLRQSFDDGRIVQIHPLNLLTRIMQLTGKASSYLLNELNINRNLRIVKCNGRL